MTREDLIFDIRGIAGPPNVQIVCIIEKHSLQEQNLGFSSDLVLPEKNGTYLDDDRMLHDQRIAPADN
jgi:hypothetical protein